MAGRDLGPDTFGAALLAALEGGDGRHAVERDDGEVNWADASQYLAPATDWHPGTAEALAGLSGRVLDVGCGAGRHALYLQQAGHEVLGFDPSPKAVEVCRRRGVDAVVGWLGDDEFLAGERFDGIVLLGNNLGLLEDAERAPRYLQWLAERCRPGALLIGEALDVTRSDSLDHIRYQRRARAEGRRPGEMSLRVVFEEQPGAWFRYWHLSPDDLRQATSGTPWTVQDVVGDAQYVATLRRA